MLSGLPVTFNSVPSHLPSTSLPASGSLILHQVLFQPTFQTIVPIFPRLLLSALRVRSLGNSQITSVWSSTLGQEATVDKRTHS